MTPEEKIEALLNALAALRAEALTAAHDLRAAAPECLDARVWDGSGWRLAAGNEARYAARDARATALFEAVGAADYHLGRVSS